MARTRKEETDIKVNVVKVLSRQEYEKGGASELRIIEWIVNGNKKAPTLERREKWIGHDGEERAGKAKGLSASDVWIILENMREIGKLMEIPAAKIAGILQEADGSSEPAMAGKFEGDDPW